MTFAVSLFLLTSAAWVFTDARRRDWSKNAYRRWSPAFWGGMTFVLWIVMFPLYVAVRSTAPRHGAQAPTTGTGKRCPSCAEDVQAQARRCRFCGHQFVGRTRWPTAIAITAGILALWIVGGAYASGRLDAPLSSVGLNTSDCFQLTYGRTLCGNDAVTFCEHSYDRQLNGKACGPILSDAGKPTPTEGS